MAFQERIAFEKGRIKTQEDFRAFISSRGNHLLLTEPRPIKILNPEEELFQLFNRLVDSNPNKAQNSGMKERIKELDGQFEAQINKQGIDGLMKRKVVLAIPLLGRTGEYSFGFQNGQQNVIKTVVFKSNNQKNVDNACVIAIEGRNLADANVKLNVLAEYDASEDDHVPKILESTGVRLIAADRMEEFAIEIKKTAH